MTGYQSKRAAAQDKLTVDREQLKQWLEALKDIDALHHSQEPESVDAQKAIADMAQALAQPEQRPWVGLTDDDIKEIVGPYGDMPIKGYTRKLFDQIEAKLKEMNT